MVMIQFQNVTQRFTDGTVAFTNLSFNIEDGELVLITGPSGSGKTTILNLLIKEYQPVSGDITMDGQSLREIKPKQLPLHRRKIGAVFQDCKLIEELNVWENIAMPLVIQGQSLPSIEERVTDLLSLVQLTSKALMFPKQLSGGEAQRISIARALATGPSVIFADEPTGNLDAKTAHHIINLLKKINELGTTLIIATHDPVIIKEIKAKHVDLEAADSEEICSDLTANLAEKPHKKEVQPQAIVKATKKTTDTQEIKQEVNQEADQENELKKPVKLKIQPKKISGFAQKIQNKIKKLAMKSGKTTTESDSQSKLKEKTKKNSAKS